MFCYSGTNLSIINFAPTLYLDILLNYEVFERFWVFGHMCAHRASATKIMRTNFQNPSSGCIFASGKVTKATRPFCAQKV